jgi:hypothetical protein
MDYYRYQEALIYRYLKQEGRWDSHLLKCRDFILRSADICKPDKVTVLGSGWLLELPLSELTERVGTVCLVDIVHPPDVIRQTSAFKNVELLECDVSGGLIEKVWNRTGIFSLFRLNIDIKSIAIPEFILKGDPGMVISLNLLSQLDALPVKLLRKRTRASENDIVDFRRRIQEEHIRFLRDHDSVLISDTVEVFTGSDGDISEEITVVAELPAAKMSEEWIWDFDLAGTDFKQKKSVLKVKALLL